MKGTGRTFGMGVLICLAAAFGAVIGRGEMPAFVERFRGAFSVLWDGKLPAQPLSQGQNPSPSGALLAHPVSSGVVHAASSDDNPVLLSLADSPVSPTPAPPDPKEPPPADGKNPQSPTSDKTKSSTDQAKAKDKASAANSDSADPGTPPPAPVISGLSFKDDGSKLGVSQPIRTNRTGTYVLTLAEPGTPSSWTLTAVDNDTPMSGTSAGKDNKSLTIRLNEGPHKLKLQFVKSGDQPQYSEFSRPIAITIVTTGPTVVGSVPENFAFQPGSNNIKVKFNSENKLDPTSAKNPSNYVLKNTSAENAQVDLKTGMKPVFDPSDNSVLLQYDALKPGLYELTVRTKPDDGTDPSASQDSQTGQSDAGDASDQSQQSNPAPGDQSTPVVPPKKTDLAVSGAADSIPVAGAPPGGGAAQQGSAGPTGANASAPAKAPNATVNPKPTGSASADTAAKNAPPGIKDVYGNFLNYTNSNTTPGEDFHIDILRPVGDDLPSESSGLSEFNGRYVIFPEYTNPRPDSSGFNPSDHVETRVARLYYFRDAARVAQILNRKSRSYNRAAVDMRRQLADKARQAADMATDDRRAAESKAIQAAQASRNAERNLQSAQVALAAYQQKDANAQQQIKDLKSQLSDSQKKQASAGAAPDANLQKQIDDLQSQLTSAQAAQASTSSAVNTAQNRVDTAQQSLQTARTNEAQKADDAQQKTAAEDRLKQDQFRLEVAAAHEDPDTYAPGLPTSIDPVEQVSVSVIGEGLIQLRGPMKGINTIRLMINEIDTPVGQVNVAVHTVQVNGEHGDRMEKVLGKIEKYIDHSRFLTAQSAQMLRNAVVTVASQKAETAMAPGMSQDFRDQKYLDAFFGTDFIDELKALDSEFLKTGNKLLTLHSMDSTSLSSALFLLALAKNSVRQEILAQFEYAIRCELPRMECEYFQAGGGKKAYGCGKFKPFSHNARFTSLIGQFNSQVTNDDTLTPLQREFIRLAQIFKSRLVTEMEFNQRVMERALIEQRNQKSGTDPDAVAKAAQDAKKRLDRAIDEKAQIIQSLIPYGLQLQSQLDALKTSVDTVSKQLPDFLGKLDPSIKNAKFPNPIASDDFVFDSATPGPFKATIGGNQIEFWIAKPQADPSCWRIVFTKPLAVGVMPRPLDATKPPPDSAKQTAWNTAFNDALRTLTVPMPVLKAINFPDSPTDDRNRQDAVALMDKITKSVQQDGTDAPFLLKNVLALSEIAQILPDLQTPANTKIASLKADLKALFDDLTKPNADLRILNERWTQTRPPIQADATDKTTLGDFVATIKAVAKLMQKGVSAEAEFRKAQQSAASASKDFVPLDHKKFLDMLIDESQEKLIELLEGTRAHTANVDNYIKRLTTALDDDLNTQFYHPAFREVRSASRMWDVNLGDIETTSILTNNRTFAKVSPQATMEFDLPKRDILIKEAFAGTKAMFDDYGALLQDPTFLALSKLNSGLPTSSTVAGTAGSSPVRNLIPGLPSQTDEQIMGQAGPGNKQFGSALEALIPDPAVYKFETGTGFEIRPVVQPDGQAVTFHFNYMYTTNVREPVRADEKHLGRVKRHFIDTDVQLSNFELRKVSRYLVALKASRTSRGVPLMEDIPGLGMLFRPLPSQESSLQQNLILAQATIFPTLFDLMGLRWAPAIADLDALRLTNDDFIVRGRRRELSHRVYDVSSAKVDESLQIPDGERRGDLYRSQETIPHEHPNGYRGPGMNLRDSQMREGYNPEGAFPESQGIRGTNPDGAPRVPGMNSHEVIPESPLDSNEQGSYRGRRPVNVPAGYMPPTAKPGRGVRTPVQRTTSCAKPAVTAPNESCAPVTAQSKSRPKALNEPQRLPPQIVSGKVKISDQIQAARPRTATGDVTPAQYTAPEPQSETKSKPKSSGVFSRFRKSEKE